MPPRLNKRQQRELEELEALNSVKPDPTNERHEENDAGPSRPMKSGGFSALLVAEGDHVSEDEEETETKIGKSRKKKKKKYAQAVPSTTGVSNITETPQDAQKSAKEPPESAVVARNEKKAAKKARAKEKKAAANNDDLDQILAELSVQYPSSPNISQSGSVRPSLTDLLPVSLPFLDADAEMRRFFGSKVVLATKTAAESSRAGSASASASNRGVRSNLTRPQVTWWPANAREGLSLRCYSDEEVLEKLTRQGWKTTPPTVHQEKWWTVGYSRKYRAMTRAFMTAVMAGDPQGLFDLLREFPWHADTLLQISEVYRHREEHAQAVDFIDRSLFTYERCLMGVFNFTTGLNRLDFDQVENRPFFLALHRQVADLQRRGCVRTSFEFARLLYGLDPWNDPHGAVFHLEYLAIKAGMHQWLLDMYDVFSERLLTSPVKPGGRLNPSILPGWAYSRALAMKIMEDSTKEMDHTKSSAALQQAARDFPSVVPLLADKLDVSLPHQIRAHKDFKIETDAQSLSPSAGTLHLLSHLYAQRSLPVWKEHASWFSSTITETFTHLPPYLPITDKKNSFLSLYDHSDLRSSVYRHVIVLESSYRRLFSFIPRQTFEGRSIACDPLPPGTSLSYYDQEFFQGVDDVYMERRGRRQRAANERVLEQIFPDPMIRRHFQDFFDANPHFAERFPGGVVEFAQMAAQMQPELLEDFMLFGALNAQPGGMPGGLDGMVDVDVEDGGENVIEVNLNPTPEDEAAGAAIRAQQQLQQQRNEGDDGDGEEDEDEDEGEYISPMPRALRNILRRFFGRNADPEAEESSSDEEGVVVHDGPPLDDTGVD